MTPRFIVYSHEGMPLFDLDPTQIISASRTEEINGEHSLTIETLQKLEKEQRILVRDEMLKWREYVVTGVEASHEVGNVVYRHYCVWGLQHDLTGTKVNKMPGTKKPVGARVALEAALSGTERYAIGNVYPRTTGGVSMYYMSGWEALSKVIEVWGGEVDVNISVDTSGVVTRTIVLYEKMGEPIAERRFDYGADMSSISRIVADDPFVCRIIPRGKGEETEGGGYGRRITIESVNGGVEYLQDDEAVPLVRLRKQGGWEYPTLIVINENIDDPQALKDWALEHLHDWTRPRVTYEAGIVQFAEAGLDAHGVALGDAVQCVDKSFSEDGLRIDGRVVKIVTNELDRSDVQLEIGYLKGSLASQFKSLQSSVETVAAYLDTLANDMSTPEWIDGLVERINREVNATGGYTYIVPGDGIRTYDKEVSDPSIGAEADAVVEIKGGTVRIANSRDGQGEWEWKTVFTSGHIAGELVTAAQIVTGYIGNAGSTYIDLDNNIIQLGDDSGAHAVIMGDSFAVINKANAFTVDIAADEITDELHQIICNGNARFDANTSAESALITRSYRLMGASGGTVNILSGLSDAAIYQAESAFFGEPSSISNMNYERFGNSVRLSPSSDIAITIGTSMSWEGSAAWSDGRSLRRTISYSASTGYIVDKVYLASGTRSGFLYSMITADMVITYPAPTMTFGNRKPGSTEGAFSSTLGRGLIATRDYQTVLGKFNASTARPFVIGNGESDANRSDLFSIDASGAGRFSGDMYVTAEQLDSMGRDDDSQAVSDGFIRIYDRDAYIISQIFAQQTVDDTEQRTYFTTRHRWPDEEYTAGFYLGVSSIRTGLVPRTTFGFLGADTEKAMRSALHLGTFDQNFTVTASNGADQIFSINATCVNDNNSLYSGDRFLLIPRNNGLGLYNSTDSGWMWNISNLARVSTTDIDSIIVPNPGNMNISDARYVQQVGVAMLYLEWSNVNAITVPANGNITDVTVGVIASGKRPAIFAAGTSNGNQTGGAWYDVSPNGTIKLTSLNALGSQYTIPAGSTFYMYSTYLLA